MQWWWWPSPHGSCKSAQESILLQKDVDVDDVVDGDLLDDVDDGLVKQLDVDDDLLDDGDDDLLK